MGKGRSLKEAARSLIVKKRLNICIQNVSKDVLDAALAGDNKQFIAKMNQCKEKSCDELIVVKLVEAINAGKINAEIILQIIESKCEV